MFQKVIALLLFTGLIYSCSENKTIRPTTSLDTGREFIRASLDGNFVIAQELLLKDSQNMQLFESYKLYYDRLPQDKKNNYKNASYTINKYSDIDDSTTIINYSNSYMNKPLEIKVVRSNAIWNVDFKYTYSGNLPIN
ncbi:MAG: hypothetical protein WKF35_12990 [Ferruginibacter sp.]